ncbi:MAG: hypothetical protein M0Z28_31785 [Rhodospirillales bacterium]|nr:hypothetical protein [Rhodospirillales bacterium]
MSDTVAWISGVVAAVLMLAMLVAGPATCTVLTQREITKQVQVACGGDLSHDAARSAACVLALRKRASDTQ